MGALTGALIVGIVFGSIAWVISIFVDAFRRSAQARATAEFQSKLLDKIGSAKEFGEFLATESGARFLDAVRVEGEAGPQARILRALQSGIVLLLVGLGLFGVMQVRALPLEAEDGVAVFATLATATGLGLLLASGATYLMSRRLGLLNGHDHPRHNAADVG